MTADDPHTRSVLAAIAHRVVRRTNKLLLLSCVAIAVFLLVVSLFFALSSRPKGSQPDQVPTPEELAPHDVRN